MSADLGVLLAEMQASFLDELPDRCHRLESAVLALEGGQGGAFDELYRQVHSLKGSGGMFDVAIITTICHQFESYISDVHARFNRQAASQALAYVDLLRRTIAPEGRERAGVAAIEQALERLRSSSLLGKKAILLVEPSDALRRLYGDVFAGQPVQLVTMANGLATLERLLHEPFDLLIISRELPDLNAVAVVAALRESRCRNAQLPVVLVSSNPAPVPPTLRIWATLRRDPQLVPRLSALVTELVQRPDAAPQAAIKTS